MRLKAKSTKSNQFENCQRIEFVEDSELDRYFPFDIILAMFNVDDFKKLTAQLVRIIKS